MVEASGSVAQIVRFAQYVWAASGRRSSVLVLHDQLSSRRAAICNSSCLRDEIFGYVAEVDKVSGRVNEPYRALHTLFDGSSRDHVSLWPLWQTSSKEHGRASTRFGRALGRLLNALVFLLPGALTPMPSPTPRCLHSDPILYSLPPALLSSSLFTS